MRPFFTVLSLATTFQLLAQTSSLQLREVWAYNVLGADTLSASSRTVGSASESDADTRLFDVYAAPREDYRIVEVRREGTTDMIRFESVDDRADIIRETRIDAHGRVTQIADYRTGVAPLNLQRRVSRSFLPGSRDDVETLVIEGGYDARGTLLPTLRRRYVYEYRGDNPGEEAPCSSVSGSGEARAVQVPEKSEVTLLDMSGRVLWQRHASSARVALPMVPTGVYVIALTSNTGRRCATQVHLR